MNAAGKATPIISSANQNNAKVILRFMSASAISCARRAAAFSGVSLFTDNS
jgi:hypothetical protein